MDGLIENEGSSLLIAHHSRRGGQNHPVQVREKGSILVVCRICDVRKRRLGLQTYGIDCMTPLGRLPRRRNDLSDG